MLCPGSEFDERIFPSESGAILGPSGDSFGASEEAAVVVSWSSGWMDGVGEMGWSGASGWLEWS